jgi:hypothetical protein
VAPPVTNAAFLDCKGMAALRSTDHVHFQS